MHNTPNKQVEIGHLRHELAYLPLDSTQLQRLRRGEEGHAKLTQRPHRCLQSITIHRDRLRTVPRLPCRCRPNDQILAPLRDRRHSCTQLEIELLEGQKHTNAKIARTPHLPCRLRPLELCHGRPSSPGKGESSFSSLLLEILSHKLCLPRSVF